MTHDTMVGMTVAPDPHVGMTPCRKCGAWYSGMLTGHCGGELGCHKTFSSIKSFDRHRGAPTRKFPFGFCKNPLDVGLVLSDRKYDCWMIPEKVGE